MKGNVYLIGYMGTGKTTVGKALAKKYPEAVFCDMDTMIEEEQKKKISDIFTESGEEAFRDMETDLLRRLSKETGKIVSCGGGAPLRPENASLMQSSGTVVWLTAKPETIYERIREDISRPLLKDKMTIDHIQSMMSMREPSYRQASTARVEVDGRLVEEIASEILTLLN